MKRLTLRIFPILFILTVWFLFSYPYVLKGLVPYPAKYQVTFFHPWSTYEQWWGPVKNNAMPDVITQIYPWKHFTVEWLKQGQIPYWNPYNFAGNPHAGNFQSAVFSPFNLLYLVLPFIDSWSIIVLLQPLLAGMFTYLFMREIRFRNKIQFSSEDQRSFASRELIGVNAQDDRRGISTTGALLASVTFMFCGFNVVWMAYGTLSMAIVFLPLALYGIEKAFNTKKKRYFFLMTVSIVISFFSGHIQTSLYFASMVLGYLFFRSIILIYPFMKRGLWRIHKQKKGNSIIHRTFPGIIFWASFFFILGIGLSLIQVYPTYSLYRQSVRSVSLHAGGGIPWNYLVTVFAPDFYGNPVTRNDWFGLYAEWASFIGIIPLSLSLLAVFFRKNSRIVFFLFMAVFTLLLAMDSPLHNLLIATRIPVLATSIPSRIIVLFSFSAAVLAGFGTDILHELLVKKSSKRLVSALAVTGSLLLLVWVLLLFANALPNDRQQTSIAIKNLILPSVLFGVTIVMVCIPIFISRLNVTRFALYGLLLLASMDSLRFAAKWMPFDPRELVFPEVPVLNAMQENIGTGRVFGNIGTEVTAYFGLSSIEGYDPLYAQRYGEFIRYAGSGIRQEAERSVARIDRRGKFVEKALDLMGVNIIFHPLADTNTTWAFPVWKDYEKYSVIYQDDKYQLYRNNRALPRAVLYYEYEIISDAEKILARIYDVDFDIEKKIIIEKEPGVAISMNDSDKIGNVKIDSYTPNNIVITADTRKPALLFLSDNFYPRWHASVNGEEKEIFRANYTFRAVAVPAGKSEVEFNYREYF